MTDSSKLVVIAMAGC